MEEKFLLDTNLWLSVWSSSQDICNLFDRLLLIMKFTKMLIAPHSLFEATLDFNTIIAALKKRWLTLTNMKKSKKLPLQT